MDGQARRRRGGHRLRHRNHDDLAELDGRRTGSSRIVYAENFATGETSTSDAYGHGTHVAGIIGGSGISAVWAGGRAVIQGMAPGVNLLISGFSMGRARGATAT